MVLVNYMIWVQPACSLGECLFGVRGGKINTVYSETTTLIVLNTSIPWLDVVTKPKCTRQDQKENSTNSIEQGTINDCKLKTVCSILSTSCFYAACRLSLRRNSRNGGLKFRCLGNFKHFIFSDSKVETLPEEYFSKVYFKRIS